MPTSLVKRWGYEMYPTPVSPGVYRLAAGKGFFVRGKTGSKVVRSTELIEALEVQRTLEQLKNKLPLWSVFAVSLFEERVLKGNIDSAATRERWHGALKDYLIPTFGHLHVDELRHQDIVSWTVELARWIKHGKPSLKDPTKTVTVAPSTANGWLRILRTIVNVQTVRFDLPRNPMDGVEFFKERTPYTAAEPNSLSPEQVKEWLRLAKTKYPQHYAMMLLGFVTGRRPGELRAMRRYVDVLWTKNQIIIRRSHSRRTEIRESTKTGKEVVLNLPQEVMDILKDHMRSLPAGDLLFPSLKTGGLRSRSALDKPFASIAKEMELPFNLTPRAMRRSFQDLCRDAEVAAVVTRSISGHATEKMQNHYSTVREKEQRAALGGVLRLVL